MVSRRALSAVYSSNLLGGCRHFFDSRIREQVSAALHIYCTAQQILVFLTIYDTAYEMLDSAIEERLKPYWKVFMRRRGTVQGYSLISNGNRHYRVALKRSVPCYTRFRRHLLCYHDIQVKTCRKCRSAEHLAREYNNTVCCNCDQLGHTSKDCPNETCCICKHEDHMTINCPFSWYRRPTLAPRDEPRAPSPPPDDSVNYSSLLTICR